MMIRTCLRIFIIFFLFAEGGYCLLMRGLKVASEEEISKPPEIYKLPGIVSAFTITVEGKTFPGAYVLVEGGSSPSGGVSHPETGEFKIEVFLRPETMNNLTIKAIDREGRITPSVTVSVIQTVSPAEAPFIYSYREYTNENMVDISGRTRPGYKVVAYGGRYPATTRSGETGDFKISVYLNPNTKNTIRIASVDAVGNMSPFTEVNVIHDTIPPLPPNILKYPPKTRSTIVEIEGQAEQNSNVLIEGGKGIQRIPVDDFGNFKGNVEILKYALGSRVNRLKVYAEDRAGNRSEPSEIVITHEHFIKKHMLFLKTGLHFYPESQYMSEIDVQPFETSGPSLEVSYDYIFKSPFSLGMGAGFYSSLGNALPGTESKVFLEVYNLAAYFIFKPAFHFMIEKFDIYAGAGGGYMNVVKINREVQSGSSRVQVITFHTWVVRFYTGLNYYINDRFSMGVEDAYSISRIKPYSDAGALFDPGGNIIFLNAGFHF